MSYRLTSHYLFDKLTENEKKGIEETLIMSENLTDFLKDILEEKKGELVRSLPNNIEKPYKTAGTIISIKEIDYIINLLTKKDKT